MAALWHIPIQKHQQGPLNTQAVLGIQDLDPLFRPTVYWTPAGCVPHQSRVSRKGESRLHVLRKTCRFSSFRPSNKQSSTASVKTATICGKAFQSDMRRYPAVLRILIPWDSKGTPGDDAGLPFPAECQRHPIVTCSTSCESIVN